MRQKSRLDMGVRLGTIVGALGPTWASACVGEIADRPNDNAADPSSPGAAPDGTSSSHSVRWTGHLVPDRTGDKTICVLSDDGMRLFLDGRLVIDDWTVHAAEYRCTDVALTKGEARAIRLEYFQSHQRAIVRLLWRDAHAKTQDVPIPADVLHRQAGTPRRHDFTAGVGHRSGSSNASR